MDSPRNIHRPHSHDTPQGEVCALAQVYSFILRVHEEKKKGAGLGTPNDAKEDLIVRADRESIP